MKKLFIAVRDYYLLHIKVVEGMCDAKDVQKYLNRFHLDEGVCYVIRRVDVLWSLAYEADEYRNYIYEHTPEDRNNWCDPPCYCNTKEGMIQALQARINILNSIIEEDLKHL